MKPELDKKIAILQSNYVPWKGYFDLIGYVDEFVIYDDMQYTRRDWRNRNKIKTSNGVQWLTIPVTVKGRFTQSIRHTKISDPGWAKKHWSTITLNYRKCEYFEEIAKWLKPLYISNSDNTLSGVNIAFIRAINSYLGIKTKISYSWDYEIVEGKTEKLVSICKQVGATQYISGPRAKDYIQQSLFENNAIELIWFNYRNYPTYPQLWGEFVHEVSILDLLFNCGPRAIYYIQKCE